MTKLYVIYLNLGNNHYYKKLLNRGCTTEFKLSTFIMCLAFK